MFKNIQARYVLLVLVMVVLVAVLNNCYQVYRTEHPVLTASQIQAQKNKEVINQLRYDYIVAEPGYKRVIAEVLVRKIEDLSPVDASEDLLLLLRKLKNKV